MGPDDARVVVYTFVSSGETAACVMPSPIDVAERGDRGEQEDGGEGAGANRHGTENTSPCPQ
jgi:hypothetical protein